MSTTIQPDGSKDSDFMVVGDAPNSKELREQKPFVGRAGNLVRKILNELDAPLDECYVTNVSKVESSKALKNKEIKECAIALAEEVTKVQPVVILTFGIAAAKAILNKYDIKLSEVRGATFTIDNIKIICTFHPDYVLNNPSRLDIFKKDITLAVDEFIKS